MKKNIIILFLMVLPIKSIKAQNFLYNTEQFGIRGSMLGGAIAAGADDESMTFYNPAGIHKVPSQVSISLFQPVIRSFGFNSFWGARESSEINTNYGLKPSLISFKFNLKNIELAFIKITKSELTDFFNAKREATNSNLLNTQYFEYEYKGEDDWFGVGTSFKLTPNIYLGISQFLSISNFEYRNKVFLEELNTANNTSNSYFNSEQTSSYDNTGFITKIGFLYDTNKHDFGFTITTPKYLRILKDGYYTGELTRIDSDHSLGRQIVDNDISPEIRTPWEFSIGYSFLVNKNSKLWLSTSYHTGISDYKVANIKSGNSAFSWVNGNKSVINFGVGYSHQISPTLELSGGFRTNNLAYENKKVSLTKLRNTILDGNQIHFVIGTKFKIKRHDVLLGLDWGAIYDTPNKTSFEYLQDIAELSPNLNGLTKQNITILLTYRFIIDELIKL
uniref:OmpP1/FadL family transporter n=1 Tax=uncultured Tenacibaculum sp. TaxID=174713 RepID=UPI0026279802|nr:hypothetical protein [uncultured Tenacibaculum sp.]